MAFLYTLTNAAVTGTDPAGTDLVSLGDDNIRNFKSAVLERLNSAFVDANSQPMILKSPTAGVGNVQSVIPTTDNTFVLGEAARRWSSVQAVLITGTQQTAAQPNITSLGVLTGLTVAGTVSGGLTVTGTTGYTVILDRSTGPSIAFNTTGVHRAAILNTGVDSLGFYYGAADTLAFTYSASGIVLSAGTFSGNLTGTVLTAAQANITSLGTLTGLTVNSGTGGFLVTGDIKVQGALSGFIIGRRDTNASAWTWYSAAGTLQLFDVVGTVDRLTLTSTLLTLSAGLTVTGTITGNLSGTILTAAQGNITSLGTLTGLAIAVNAALPLNITRLDAAPFAGAYIQFTSSAFGISGYIGVDTASGQLTFQRGADAAKSVALDRTSGVLTAIFGLSGNVTGNLTGTVLTAAQANITSLGILTGLSVSGDSQLAGIRQSGSSIARFENVFGAVPAGITGIGFEIGVSGASVLLQSFNRTTAVVAPLTITAAGATVFTNGVSGNLTGTILTAAQGNITSLGVLTSLSVSGLITASGGITVGSNLQGVGRFALGNGLGAQITLAKVSTVAPTVANAAQQAWLKVVGDDAITYFVPAFT